MIVKTPEELEALREGGRRLAQHVREISKLVVPGATGRELEAVAREMVKNDGDEPAFLHYKSRKNEHPYPAALCLSVNDIIVHSPASDNGAVIQEGDVVCVDFGIKHAGFFTDHAATVIAGTPKNADDEMLVRAAYEALEAGIREARVGNTTGHIGFAVQQVAEKYGLDYPRNLSGHGVGRAVHEPPHIPNYGIPGEGEPIVENMVIAIEPMFALGSADLMIDKVDGHSYRTKDGSRTSHAEHTVYVTKDGPEILTK